MDKQTLPENAKPMHYDLQIEPDIDAGTFEGSAAIDIEPLKDLTSLTLNSKDPKFQKAEIYISESVLHIRRQDIRIDIEREQVKLLLNMKIRAGDCFKMYIDFSGAIGSSGAGLFKSQIPDSESWMLSTEMEPTDARTVFPCFDEPALKATFSVSLVVEKSLSCLSNMPVASDSDTKDCPTKRLVKFAKTPVMSTYLLAFAIGDFYMIESTKYRCPIRVWAPKEHNIQNGSFALEIAVQALEIHEKTFDINFPLSKMDLLVVPGANGAMENWGLCTFQPRYLLVGTTTKASDKLTAASTIVHELAHQWFGNLVTMRGWADLWLNEAFADWAAFHALSQIEGFGDSWLEFLADGYQLALYSDSIRNSHPIEVKVNRPSDIGQIFDDITYKKGCAVLRMISNVLGEDTFLEGVTLYLKGRLYGNSTTEDLWEALGQAGGWDLRAFAEVWTKSAGYPVVTVQEHGSEDMRITQNRFLITGPPIDEEDKMIFSVVLKPGPVSWPIKDVQDMNAISLNSRSNDFPLSLISCKVNQGQFGFYRVAYCSNLWERILSDLDKGLLSVSDRIGIVSDSAALAFSGHPFMRTSSLLSLLQRLQKETDFFVWKTIIVTLREIAKTLMFAEDGTQEAISEFQRQLVQVVTEKVGYSFDGTESLNHKRFKALLFGNCASMEVHTSACKIFNRFVRGDLKAIDPNIRAEVFKIILQTGGTDEYRKLFALLAKITEPSISDDIIRSLGYSQDLSCVQSTLRFALSPDSVSQNQVLMIISPLTTHKVGVEVLCRLLQSGDWLKIPNLSLRRLGPIIQAILESFTTLEQLESVKSLFEGVDTTGFEAVLAQSLDGIQARASWVERDHEDVVVWLRENGF